ncbi:hypothetical protein ACGFMM_09230 [Streptomyces sp. NPDC048604]|uniref:hypothetical protein n=1 Tax=Streptomyces sp. NPDC048604 TaxID=3365578 RepID=UPI0037197CF1
MFTHKLTAVSAAAVALGSTLLLAPAASAASAAPAEQAATCRTVKDSTRFGASCFDSGLYRAVARCADGRTVPGPWVRDQQWSYASCTSIGSTVTGGYVQFA